MAFHQFRISAPLRMNWESLLGSFDIEAHNKGSIMLLQCIICRMLEHLVTQAGHECQKLRPGLNAQENKDFGLSDIECQIVRYISGYIPYSLLKRFCRQKNNKTASTFVEILSTWRDASKSDAPNFWRLS